MKIIAVIPVRLASSRFPEKALYKIGGVALIERVYNAAKSIDIFDEVVIATDSRRIMDYVQDFGGKVVETSSAPRSGTERVAELVDLYADFDVFVNIQADQAFLNKEMIESLLSPYLNGELLNMTTLACPLRDHADLVDPDSVKVIIDRNGDAIYFSRSSIPFVRESVPEIPVYHHLGLYAFSKEFLSTYSTLEPSTLEMCESLEQLRVLDHGYKIRVKLIDTYVPEINNPGDIRKAQDINLI